MPMDRREKVTIEQFTQTAFCMDMDIRIELKEAVSDF